MTTAVCVQMGRVHSHDAPESDPGYRDGSG